MASAVPDLAQVRLDNALLLFDDFVRQAARHPDPATLRGLEGRFAERLGIQPSYWSQLKSRSRQIGERLARQFEQAMRKPYGWMDLPHRGVAAVAAVAAGPPPAAVDDSKPADDDERFIVGLVLTYYRRHPERARTRLLELLSEVLVVPAAAPMPGAATSTPGAAPPGAAARAPGRAVAPGTDRDLWRQTAAAVAPLKRRR